jgi:hypothetical protein
MGMNFFMVKKATDEERKVLQKFNAKQPQLHIGKSSMGWQFLFHSPDSFDLDEFGIRTPIRSFQQWKRLLATNDEVEILDEEGKVVPFDKFVSWVENKRNGLNHVDELMKGIQSFDRDHAREKCFVDDEGHPFDTAEFS